MKNERDIAPVVGCLLPTIGTLVGAVAGAIIGTATDTNGGFDFTVETYMFFGAVAGGLGLPVLALLGILYRRSAKRKGNS